MMEFIKAPDQTKAEYLHSLCGGDQSSTHHGAYAKERHTTPYKNGIPQPVQIEQV